MDEPVNRAIKMSGFAVGREDVDVEVVADSSLIWVNIAQSKKQMPTYKADCSSKNHTQVERLLSCTSNLFPSW